MVTGHYMSEENWWEPKKKKTCWTRGRRGQQEGDPGGDRIGRGVSMRGEGDVRPWYRDTTGVVRAVSVA